MLLIYAYIEEINPDVNSLLYDIFKLLLRKYLLLQATIIEAKDHKFYHFSKVRLHCYIMTNIKKFQVWTKNGPYHPYSFDYYNNE